MNWQDLRIDSSGVGLAVREYGGAGPGLLLVHGGPGQNLAAWDDFAPYLTPHFRVIAFDQRGHGESEDAYDYSYPALAEDIQAVARALGIQHPIVVGHSWGGQVVLVYASLYHECAGVVAIDGLITHVGTKMSEDAWAWIEREVLSDPLMTFVGTPEALDEAISHYKAASPEEGFSESMFRRQLTMGSDGLMRWHRSAAELMRLQREIEEHGHYLSIDLYQRIRCPVLIVGALRGGEGRPARLGEWPFGREAIERLHVRYPHLLVEWLPCGHNVPSELPDDLTALIVDFDSSLAP